MLLDWLLTGNSLLVKPVTEQHSTSVSVYMPGMNAVSNMWCAVFRVYIYDVIVDMV